MRLVYKTIKAHLVKDEKLLLQFYNNSFKSAGLIYKTLLEEKEKGKRSTAKVVYCLKRKKVVGWGICSPHNNKKGIMLYVNKRYRRKGIGSALFKRLAWGIPKNKVNVWPHNRLSEKFFNKNLYDKIRQS